MENEHAWVPTIDEVADDIDNDRRNEVAAGRAESDQEGTVLRKYNRRRHVAVTRNVRLQVSGTFRFVVVEVFEQAVVGEAQARSHDLAPPGAAEGLGERDYVSQPIGDRDLGGALASRCAL